MELLSEEIDFNELQRLLNIDEVKLIDVRTPKEIQEHGKIEGSTNIPSKFIVRRSYKVFHHLQLLASWAKLTLKFRLVDQIKEAFQLSEKEFTEKYGVFMPKKTDKNIVFHCGSGKRSRRAIDYVKDLGYRLEIDMLFFEILDFNWLTINF